MLRQRQILSLGGIALALLLIGVVWHLASHSHNLEDHCPLCLAAQHLIIAAPVALTAAAILVERIPFDYRIARFSFVPTIGTPRSPPAAPHI
jgi:hypothetical protein